MQSGAASPRQNGICQLSSGSVGFKDAIVELRRGHADRRAPLGGRTGHRPPPLRPHLQRSGAARHRVSRHSSSNFSLELTKYTSVNVEGGGKATTTHTTPLSRSEAATDSCSALSSNLTAAENAYQRPYMREKLHLCPRVTVIPFIIESFGRTHRYRPLAHLSEPKQAGSSGSSIHSGGDKGAPVDVFDRFAGVPWKHPIAADEMVTPRTEALLRDILRRLPDSTSASDDATFLHCALKRSYDADSDRFSYVDSPAFVQLMYKRFASLLTAIKARMQTAPPVLRLSSPLLCGGDLLGSFADLMVLLSSVAHFSHWSTVHTPLLLLGNYVDVGWHSVEVFMLLCCWAYLQPNKVHLLRGPHEDPAVNGNYRLLRKRCLRYKCRQRFGSRRGITLWAQLNDVFALLPVAAVIDERIFATHGGIPLLRVSTPPSREEGRVLQCSVSVTSWRQCSTCTASLLAHPRGLRRTRARRCPSRATQQTPFSPRNGSLPVRTRGVAGMPRKVCGLRRLVPAAATVPLTNTHGGNST
ncbi:protein phosphotase, putative [Leishmania tarentolae]|uniref:Protein phosphotase, putative n=1 Tax=Leishmania tarentolae TaxID=5689 RepID=A0A640KGN9_LEITA|nr:protein phosphotase, putative [Leishmania tarentolae]